MGTNYYWQEPASDPCESCGRFDVARELHIGKSSDGWCFALHVDPENGPRNFAEWEDRWREGKIVDECGSPLTPEAMRAIIAERSSATYPSGAWLSENNAQRGPAGLVRSRLGGHCVGHGSGTWDLITGEFS